MVSKCENDDDISPASIPVKGTEVTWREESVNNISIIDEICCVWKNTGRFYFCRSEQEFSSGVHRIEIQVDYGNKEGQISYGVCWDQNFKQDCGLYYFNNAYIYCNYYPSFTKHFINQHKETPPVSKNLSFIAINLDFDEHQIWWEIDGQECEKILLEHDGKSLFIVCSVFDGKVTFI